MFLSIFLLVRPAKAQYKYSIDLNNNIGRRTTVKSWLINTKNNFIASKEWRKNKKIEEKISKKIRKHSYKIQKSYVKKRMKRSWKSADNHNKNKLPLYIKIKRWRDG